jgi:hypothetical protein
MPNLSEITNELSTALIKETKAAETLEAFDLKANEQREAFELKLTTQREPLMLASKEASNTVTKLIVQRMSILDPAAPKTARGGVRGKRGTPINLSPETKVIGSYKRTITKGLKKKMSMKEAEKLGREAAETLAKTLGIAVPTLPKYQTATAVAK